MLCCGSSGRRISKNCGWSSVRRPEIPHGAIDASADGGGPREYLMRAAASAAIARNKSRSAAAVRSRDRGLAPRKSSLNDGLSEPFGMARDPRARLPGRDACRDKSGAVQLFQMNKQSPGGNRPIRKVISDICALRKPRPAAQTVLRPENPKVTVVMQTMLTAAESMKTARGSPWSINMP